MSALTLLLALAAAATQNAVDARAEPVVAFVDVRVVTLETDAILEGQTVLVRGERIERIGPRASVEVPDGATRVDGHGAYLMPGLVDLHVHLQDDEDLELYVLNGVTTVRECNGGVSALLIAERTAAGTLFGPEVLVASPSITGFGQGLQGAELAEAARALVEPYAERGYGFLKIYGDITAEGYGALVRAARAAGIRPIGHIPRNLTLADVLAEPPDSVAHAEEFLYGRFSDGLDRAAFAEVARDVAASGLAVVTTLVTYDHIGRQVADLAQEFERGETRYASALHLRDWAADRNRHKHFERSTAPFFRTALAFQKDLVGALHRAGVPILLGTDSGGDGIPFVFAGFSAHEELAHLVDCGLTPYEAVAAATREPARYLGTLADAGTVAEGKRADLVLVWGNPLEDVRNASLRAGVMVRGTWIPSAEIHARLDRIAERSRREVEFVAAAQAGGVEAAREVLAQSLAAEPSLVPFRERTLNELGYEALYIADDAALAVELFRLNVEVHPDSYNAHDSLAEGLVAAGRRAEAIASYRRSLELYPGNDGGARALAELTAGESGR